MMVGLIEDDASTNKKRLAGVLEILARHAESAEDFAQLADAVSWLPMTRGQLDKLYDQLTAPDIFEVTDPPAGGCERHGELLCAPCARLATLWSALWGSVEHRDRETEELILTALELYLEAYGADGAVFSSNTVLMLLPEHRRALAGKVIQRMKNGRLEPAGRETSLVPSRRHAKVRTYRLRSR